ncbi:aminodeoxychorismate synthase component I [Bacillus cereus]|nr:aminodeoxychorismate synthase component I [Bacillus cereus]
MKYFLVEIENEKRELSSLISELGNEEYIFFLDTSSVKMNEFSKRDYKERYSYVGWNIISSFEYYNDEKPASIVMKEMDLFLEKYSQLQAGNLINSPDIKPQFFTFLSYNFGEKIMDVWEEKDNISHFPDVACYFCSDNLIYDHQLEKLYYIVITNEEFSTRRLKQRFSMKFRIVNNNPKSYQINNSYDESIKSNMSFEKYISTIKKVKEYIYRGHIYQVNICQKFSWMVENNPWELYKKIRKSNPAPFSSYMKMKQNYILSTSPERFLKRYQNNIYTEPIKGTRPRGQNPEEDKKNYEGLKNSVKECSENTMIVDLLRNDLGRIAEYGTVKVEKLMFIEAYKSVFQMISLISAKLKENLSFGDIILETFPGGSITGCPKKRAVEIIRELEPESRALYTGTLGRISYDLTDFDLSIIIRTILLNGNNASLSLGGGIVYDSKEEKEYQETLDKGNALIIGLANKSEEKSYAISNK